MVAGAICYARRVACDDCRYRDRYVGSTAYARAKSHAQRLGHRTRVLAANGTEQDTVYDRRPTPES